MAFASGVVRKAEYVDKLFSYFKIALISVKSRGVKAASTLLKPQK
jgi:hypothetical protein